MGLDRADILTGVGVRAQGGGVELWMASEQAQYLTPGIPRRAGDGCSEFQSGPYLDWLTIPVLVNGLSRSWLTDNPDLGCEPITKGSAAPRTKCILCGAVDSLSEPTTW